MTNAKPKVDDIRALLDDLRETQLQLEVLRIERQEMYDAAMTPEVKAEIEAINAELGPKLDAAEGRIRILRDKAKKLVIRYGQSVKAKGLHAVFNDGKTSWDTKGLEGYAKAHPEVLELRKVGKPSVALRAVKED